MPCAEKSYQLSEKGRESRVSSRFFRSEKIGFAFLYINIYIIHSSLFTLHSSLFTLFLCRVPSPESRVVFFVPKKNRFCFFIHYIYIIYFYAKSTKRLLRAIRKRSRVPSPESYFSFRKKISALGTRHFFFLF